ncbi:type VII secretion target [Amycolatopsis alkalitolerans]|uniref:ESX-1 secretion-associated protein n=1 Tax=Amycolatopsis alkalitolerans TaxID=2547244 RepID=A0A5C4M8E4_9PSEU|nr:type VII secretion target [Amycolatopsis alkalitolerans]TNC29675.1 ESX-1 secretion-associated protein [Amycolatopsis alkalitolerans]
MSFEVVPDELRTHASHLDGLSDRLNTAVNAAGTVVMDSEAYGLLCSFLPPIVNATTQQDATDTLKSAVEGMSTTAGNVRTAASSYDERDKGNARPFEAQLRSDATATRMARRIGTAVAE